MRAADVLEIHLASGHTPEQALENVVDGETTWVGVHEGVAEVIFGVAPHPTIPGWGVPWLLGTDNIIKFRTEFIRNSYTVVDNWSEQYAVLVNFVHAENKLSKLWLKRLGFILFPEQTYGIHGARFNLFMRKR